MADKRIDDKEEDTSFDGPANTGDAHAKRPADRKNNGENKLKKFKVPEVYELFAGEGLSEDFIEKASILFESAVSEKVSDIKESLEEELHEKLETAYEELQEKLLEHLDEYLEECAEDFFNDNKMVIEDEFRSEIAEGLVNTFFQIAEAASFSIPETDADIVRKLSENNKFLQNKYSKVLSENIELTKAINQNTIQKAFDKATHDLSEATKDKLFKLTENMSFESVDDFDRKFKIIKESVTDKKAKGENRNITESFSRDEGNSPRSLNDIFQSKNMI